MLKLDAYNKRDIQNARQILEQCRVKGMAIDQCLQALAGILATEGDVSGKCPECGARLMPVLNPDNLRIRGCRKCRYSEVF